jgi:hypothetical protein
MNMHHKPLVMGELIILLLGVVQISARPPTSTLHNIRKHIQLMSNQINYHEIFYLLTYVAGRQDTCRFRQAVATVDSHDFSTWKRGK